MVKRIRLSEGGFDESEDPNAEEEKDSLDVGDPRYRQALVLFVQGQTHRQIAAYFNKSERTIRRWI